MSSVRNSCKYRSQVSSAQKLFQRDKLFFIADDGITGPELHMLRIEGVPTPVTLTPVTPTPVTPTPGQPRYFVYLVGIVR